ncbi:TonB family protein [Mucilaginibacter corticis]|uniref:TonB family protein n=1 Tax=Mucilaginibacter corticis TaxID=2597670 RepID=A0A556MKS5_9SPHI|nr:energy transducer TonB [Mucilaginibacter corticis]TSJ40468.1 TonB family protein [Mucilaginibacter corticis]
MKCSIFITLIFCLFCFNYSSAQDFPRTYFYKNDDRLVKTRDSADYILVISAPDTGSKFYNFTEYYADNKIRSTGKTSEPDYRKLEGHYESFYPSGQKNEIATYNHNDKIGDYYKCYPDGKLYTHKFYEKSGENGSDYGAKILIVECRAKSGRILAANSNGKYIGYDNDFKNKEENGPIKNGLREGTWKGKIKDKHGKLTFIEEYKNGELISGKAVDKDKKTYTYQARAVQPKFFDGFAAFGTYLANNIKYPYHARVNRISGIVLIDFVVEKDGSLTDFKVKRSPDGELSEEALRVLKASPKWAPAAQYGMPVRVRFTLPVRFNI